MTDEQRTDSLGCYGSPWARSPNIDRLASQGVIFDNAVTPAPVCVPARTSLITGRYPHQTEIWCNGDIHREMSNLMPVFRSGGYATASFGKRHYVASAPGFDHEIDFHHSSLVGPYRYDAQYDEKAYNVIKYPSDYSPWILGGRFPESASQKSEARAVRLGREWLENHDPSKPFFLRISFNGPHTPVVPPAPFKEMIDPSSIQLPEAAEEAPEGRPAWLAEELHEYAKASRLSSAEIDRLRSYYYGEVSFLDHQFGILLDWMNARGFLEDTIIVLVSDHGTHLGDYGLVQKQTFYEPVVKVPFMICDPGRFTGGVRIDRPVEIRTLLPTLIELAGLSSPEGASPDSLARVLVTGEEPQHGPVFSEFTLGSISKFGFKHNGRLIMVRDDPWKLTACLDPGPHDISLHDLEEDPYEQTNLANDPKYNPVKNRLLEGILVHIGS